MGLFDWLFGKGPTFRSANFDGKPKVAAHCIACLDGDNKGIVLVKESIIKEAVASKPSLTEERAAKAAAAQLGLLTCHGGMSPGDLVTAAASMSGSAEVTRLSSAAKAVDGLPTEWEIPVYQVIFK